jgi:predicted transcriptional regulator
MGQTEVYEFVKKHPNCTSKEIADELQLSRSSVSNSLAKLRKYNEIKQKLVTNLSYPQFYYVANEKPLKNLETRNN